MCNGQLKTKNGKNFVVEEEHQTSCLFLNVLQDMVIGKEQKLIAFCDMMQNLFNEFCLIDYVPRFRKSLEKNEVSSNKMLPSSKETTLLCFFFENQRPRLKMHFKSSRL